MSNLSAAPRKRCLFFGMPCAFSAIILDGVRRMPLELVGIVTPDRSRASDGNQLSSPKPFLALHPPVSGHLDTAPRFAVRSLRDGGVIETLIDMPPDLVIVACFPWLVPPQVIEAARVAAINLHPSLLPRWRGPDPLFWTFREGDTRSGITLHLLDGHYDSGPIIAQESVPIRDGETLPDLERRLAILGVSKLADLVRSLPQRPTAYAQDDSRATTAPIPDDEARTIDAGWSVARARRFICGVSVTHGPLRYRDDDGSLRLVSAVGTYDSTDQITFADGSLAVTLGSAKQGTGTSQL